jgi:hypothetical protein
MTQQATFNAIKIQFPEVKFWMFVGAGAGKRIKGQMYPRHVAVPVWERKAQLLMKRLPYMRLVDEAALGVASAPQARKEAVVIPDEWWNLHHKRRISLAMKLSNEDIRSVARADDILHLHKPRPAQVVEKQAEAA